MRLLLDTHTFIWLDNSPDQLSTEARKLLQDTNNDLLLSIVSVWEIQIKAQLGRLSLQGDLAKVIQEQQEINGIELLPITLHHVLALSKLPSHHGDPFDRLLISQSRIEDVTLVSRDRIFSSYPVDVLW
jgi:PIN domain nuclease of toxin-antitoxin system